MSREFDSLALQVILVEPSGAQVSIIGEQLKRVGVGSFEAVSTGSQALALMERTACDLVISAMHLSDMTGTELVLRMRQSERLARIPFLLISSETGYRFLEPVRQAGAVAILPKPFKIDHLTRAFNAILDHGSPEQLELEVDLAALHVLLVDDSHAARRAIRRVLEGIGFKRFTEAENGRQAIEHLTTTFYDFVVTDYHMPEVDGRALVHYIRAESNQSSIPILMVTAESDSCRLAGVRQEGADAICDKPFEPACVRVLIRQLLGSSC